MKPLNVEEIKLLVNDLQLLAGSRRSEEHTSELQSQSNLVCRLLLEKKKDKRYHNFERCRGYRSSKMAVASFDPDSSEPWRQCSAYGLCYTTLKDFPALSCHHTSPPT